MLGLSTCRDMRLVFFVTSVSPDSRSLPLSGRMRQKTRIEPLRSSMALWSFFLRISASAMWASGTPLLIATWMASLSDSLAARSASMLLVSTVLASASACFTAPRSRSFSSSCLSSFTAGLYSLASSGAASAAAIASFSAAMAHDSIAFSRSSRAACFGSSSLSTAFACLIWSFSTPASFACWMANFSLWMSRSSMAPLSAASAFSFDSAPARSFSNSTSSSLSMPILLASCTATLSAAASPASCATRSCSRTSAFGSSTASTFFASLMSLLGTPASSAFVMALRSFGMSKSSRAVRSLSFAFAIDRSSLMRSAAAWRSLSSAPAPCANLIAASSSFSVPLLSSRAFSLATAFASSDSSSSASSTATSCAASSLPSASSIMADAFCFFSFFFFLPVPSSASSFFFLLLALVLRRGAFGGHRRLRLRSLGAIWPCRLLAGHRADGPVALEHLDDAGLVEVQRVVQRGVSLEVLHVDVGLSLQQNHRDVLVAVGDREHQRRAAVVVPGLQGGPSFQEHLDDLLLHPQRLALSPRGATLGRVVQGALLRVVHGVDVDLVLMRQQVLHDGRVPQRAGVHQRGLASRIAAVQVRPAAATGAPHHLGHRAALDEALEARGVALQHQLQQGLDFLVLGLEHYAVLAALALAARLSQHALALRRKDSHPAGDQLRAHLRAEVGARTDL
mmetsp:Transcript_18100/g.46687  ORF Transcript_18100/g.46687 Transcript_18100/m.46687 type:complete len:680 (-) Transcript_18100:742-2781(-)